MKKNYLKVGLLSLAISTSMVGCKENKEIKEPEVLESVVDEIEDEVEEIEKVVEEVKEEQYDINDLYLATVPTGELVERAILEKLSENDGKVKYRIITTGDEFETLSGIVDCGEEWWCPDYSFYTISPLIKNQYVKEVYNSDSILSKEEVASLEKKMWNAFDFTYYREHTYDINKLILVNAEEDYSMYSMERHLSYQDKEGNPVIYLFDLCNYRNALKITCEPPEGDTLDPIDFSDIGGNVIDTRISSIDKRYADSMQDKELDIIVGGAWYHGTFGKYNVQVKKFSKYITDEQEERGYLTQDEVESIVSDLNNQKTKKKNY